MSRDTIQRLGFILLGLVALIVVLPILLVVGAIILVLVVWLVIESILAFRRHVGGSEGKGRFEKEI